MAYRWRRAEALRDPTMWVRKTAAAIAGFLAVAAAFLLIAPAFEAVAETGFRSDYLAKNNTLWLDTPLARFHYMKVGSGPPIILIPGGGQWLYSYRDTIPVLATRFTVYAVDLPGQGYTQLRDRAFAYDFPAMSESIAAFIDGLKLDRVSLVGHSWGGSWSLYFAAAHPERVDRLVLIDSPAFEQTETWDWWPLGVPLVGELMTDMMRRSDLQRMMRKSHAHPDRVTGSDVNENWAPLTREENRDALWKWQQRLQFTNMPAVISAVQSETLVLWGADDYFDAPWQAAALGRQLPRAVVRVFPGCGHSLHEDCPAEFNAALMDFLPPPVTAKPQSVSKKTTRGNQGRQPKVLR
jgi:pimeloyl-ACP methyl ester carboxylesterase